MQSGPKQSRSTRRALANEITRAIQLRLYRPGEWLRQIDLEAKFQATRSDVRGALEELAVRKAIEHLPNRGYRVAAIDFTTYRAIRDTRVLLEVGAAPGVVANIDDAAITRLGELAREFSSAVMRGTQAEQSEINSAFHRLFYAACGNPVLEETIWALRDRSRGSDVTIWSSHEVLLASDRDHHEMVEALRCRDSRRTAELIKRHIVKDATRGPGQQEKA